MRVISKSVSGPASRLILEFDMLDSEDRVRAKHATNSEDLWCAAFNFREWLIRRRKDSEGMEYGIYNNCITIFLDEFNGLLDE